MKIDAETRMKFMQLFDKFVQLLCAIAGCTATGYGADKFGIEGITKPSEMGFVFLCVIISGVFLGLYSITRILDLK